MHQASATPFASALVETPGARVFVKRCGAGPAVICLHATGHGARDFDRLAERLGDSFEFVAIDWPGQGESPPEAAPASAARYAAILAEIVDRLDLRRAILLGNSIGGAAAIAYAASHPERVRGVVLCNAGGLFASTLPLRMFCRHMARRFERGARGDPGFPGWFARYYRGVLPRPDADWRRREIAAQGAAVAGVIGQAWRSFAAPEADQRALVPTLAMPVLYAWGRRDRVLPWAWARPAAMRAPQAEAVLFDAGHSPFLEAPAPFDRAFRAFAGRLPA